MEIEIGVTEPVCGYSSTEFEIMRRWPDGLVELKYPNGKLRRVQYFQCVKCKNDAPEFWFNQVEKLCLECFGPLNDERKTAARAAVRGAMWGTLTGGAVERRKSAFVLAKVSWRDHAKIREIYKHAELLTAATGIPHSVDHFYPVQGALCCGLHVHENLRVITQEENIRKSNSMPLEESPALVMAIEEDEDAVLDWIHGLWGLDTWGPNCD